MGILGERGLPSSLLNQLLGSLDRDRSIPTVGVGTDGLGEFDDRPLLHFDSSGWALLANSLLAHFIRQERGGSSQKLPLERVEPGLETEVYK